MTATAKPIANAKREFLPERKSARPSATRHTAVTGFTVSAPRIRPGAHWTPCRELVDFRGNQKNRLREGRPMRRRDFVGGLGVAAAWPFVARGQQPERMRHVGVLIFSAEDDPVTATRTAGVARRLAKIGLD